MIDGLDAIKEAGVAIERQSLALLGKLIVAGKEGQPAIDAVLETAMQAAGCSVEPLDYAPDAVPLVDEFAADTVAATTNERCLIGRLRGQGNGRSLLLFAHPDTEDARDAGGWRTDPFHPAIRDGRLHGWGVADDLAGLAMLVQSVRLLKAAGLGPDGDVVLVSAPSKRHRRGIAAALHRGISADAAVYLHPAESGRGLDEIKAYAPGQLEFTITVSGRLPDTSEPAHTAFAHRAVNAFDKAMTIAAALKAFDDRRGRDMRHPTIQDVIGRSANLMLSACRFGSPDKLSRLAPSCQLGGAMTLIPGERLDDVMTTVEEAVANVARKDGWLRENPPAIEWLAGVSAAETERTSDLYRLVSGTLERLGASPKVNPLHTSSDIRNPMVQKAMPTVGFGPLCGGLVMSGEVDEWVDVADYHRAILATALVIADWCSVTEQDTTR
ncbi:MAG: M20/M25/M40 family metallo-hydrolase [Alphaproteobacteria bacterium]|nr:M20/M25/M40 family metallo-hydrolase [Alphaproteobacteria bacterium]